MLIHWITTLPKKATINICPAFSAKRTPATVMLPTMKLRINLRMFLLDILQNVKSSRPEITTVLNGIILHNDSENLLEESSLECFKRKMHSWVFTLQSADCLEDMVLISKAQCPLNGKVFPLPKNEGIELLLPSGLHPRKEPLEFLLVLLMASLIILISRIEV